MATKTKKIKEAKEALEKVDPLSAMYRQAKAARDPEHTCQVEGCWHAKADHVEIGSGNRRHTICMNFGCKCGEQT